eukprot:912028-Rhodomonas_salina.4
MPETSPECSRKKPPASGFLTRVRLSRARISHQTLRQGQTRFKWMFVDEVGRVQAKPSEGGGDAGDIPAFRRSECCGRWVRSR